MFACLKNDEDDYVGGGVRERCRVADTSNTHSHELSHGQARKETDCNALQRRQGHLPSTSRAHDQTGKQLDVAGLAYDEEIDDKRCGVRSGSTAALAQ